MRTCVYACMYVSLLNPILMLVMLECIQVYVHAYCIIENANNVRL
jgi:hypothetical protein